MAKPKDEGCLEFKELSEEAQKRALDKWRNKGWDWDQTDADQLSELFKEILVEKGFLDDVVPNWSLAYCQGDGVCFSGHIDAEKLFQQKGWKKYKHFGDRISIKVTHDGRYCHWNSMSVEISFDAPSMEELIPKKMYEQMTDWQVQKAAGIRAYRNQCYQIDKERVKPFTEWIEFKRGMSNGVLAWVPDPPDDLDIPYPDKPAEIVEPARFVAAREKAEAKVKEMETEINEIEEDVREYVKDVSRELEKMGYEEIEYRGSDEVIIDTIEANDYTFTEDGDMC